MFGSKTAEHTTVKEEARVTYKIMSYYKKALKNRVQPITVFFHDIGLLFQLSSGVLEFCSSKNVA